MTQDNLILEILNYFKSQRGIANVISVPRFGTSKDEFEEAIKVCIESNFITRVSNNYLDFQDFQITNEGISRLKTRIR